MVGFRGEIRDKLMGRPDMNKEIELYSENRIML